MKTFKLLSEGENIDRYSMVTVFINGIKTPVVITNALGLDRNIVQSDIDDLHRWVTKQLNKNDVKECIVFVPERKVFELKDWVISNHNMLDTSSPTFTMTEKGRPFKSFKFGSITFHFVSNVYLG